MRIFIGKHRFISVFCIAALVCVSLLVLGGCAFGRVDFEPAGEVTAQGDTVTATQESAPGTDSETVSVPPEDPAQTQANASDVSTETTTAAPAPSETEQTAAQTTEPRAETETAPPADATQEAPPAADDIVRRINNLSLREKIAQMIVVRPEVLAGISDTATVAGSATKKAFDQTPVGGVIYMGANLQSEAQTKALCADMQAISMDRLGVPAFICVDEEGGTVARVGRSGRFNVPVFGDMADLGRTGTPADAKKVGAQIGAYLAKLGFNVDFAPDTDVLTNPENTVVKRRSFGSDGALVTAFAAAYAEGLRENGILATYKHFPGHGATAEDSHVGFAVSHRTLQELRENDLLPFYGAVSAGIPFVMVGHITLPNASSDGLPASLSKELVTGLLRQEMGYKGIIITDSLEMGAITQNYTLAKAAVLAVEAGNDILLMPGNLNECVDALLNAVQTGEIAEERINESVYRILTAKQGLRH